MLPVVLCAAGGVLLGGAWSLRGQGAGRVVYWLVAVLGLVALLAGVFWMLPKGTLG
jgi:hypothetical protein